MPALILLAYVGIDLDVPSTVPLGRCNSGRVGLTDGSMAEDSAILSKNNSLRAVPNPVERWYRILPQNVIEVEQSQKLSDCVAVTCDKEVAAE